MKYEVQEAKLQFDSAVKAAVLKHSRRSCVFSPQTPSETGLHGVSAEENGRHSGGC